MITKPAVTSKKTYSNLLGVVLSGGQGTRMGGVDKGLVTFRKKMMASYAINALKDCRRVIINANRNQDNYKKYFGIMVISDFNRHSKINKIAFGGPLAGILSALDYAKQNGYQWIITCPCDAPFVTNDYLEGMWRAKQSSQKKIFIASDGFRQPVFSLLHIDIYKSLIAFLANKKNKKIMSFYEGIGYEIVIFEDSKLFTNINSLQDKIQHESLSD